MEITLAASAARTAAGQGTAVEVGSRSKATVAVDVTAGSGTVGTFRVWIEGSIDGTTWHELIAKRVLKAGAAAPGAASTDQRDIVNETAVQTSAKYVAEVGIGMEHIRAAWNIAGTTPSETFSVLADIG